MTGFDAQEFMESVLGRSPWADTKKGDRVHHPEHGTVTITGGQFWGEHGLSNFWYWTDAEGNEHCGYGWDR